MGILPIPYVNYENPSWLVSLAATKITGTLTKLQQHAQTAYKDEANTWAQAQTFAQAVTLGVPHRISLDADNGIIDWGLALTGNSRGSLTWDTNKAIVSSPLRLDLQSIAVVLSAITTVCSGELIFVPTSSTTLSSQGQFCIDRISNTQIRLKLRGDDDTNRFAILTLS